MRIEYGRITRYQTVVTTSWNFSPRDAGGTPGPLELALVGTTGTAGDEPTVNAQATP